MSSLGHFLSAPTVSRPLLTVYPQPFAEGLGVRLGAPCCFLSRPRGMGPSGLQSPVSHRPVASACLPLLHSAPYPRRPPFTGSRAQPGPGPVSGHPAAGTAQTVASALLRTCRGQVLCRAAASLPARGSQVHTQASAGRSPPGGMGMRERGPLVPSDPPHAPWARSGCGTLGRGSVPSPSLEGPVKNQGSHGVTSGTGTLRE